MKLTGNHQSTAALTAKAVVLSQPESDLKASLITLRRKTGNQPRLKKLTRSRPETPLLKWKSEQGKEKDGVVDKELEEGRKRGRRRRRKAVVAVTARKLAAGLWRLQLPDMVDGGSCEQRRKGGTVGFEPGAGLVGPHHQTRTYHSKTKYLLHGSGSAFGAKNTCKLEPSFQFSNTAMEGATKWSPVCLETTNDAFQIYGQMKRLDQQVSAVSIVAAIEAELEQARVRVQELEADRRSSKKKMEHFLKKVSEERAVWRSKEHEKIHTFIDDIKAELKSERKNRQRLEIVNSKLVNELSDAKVTAKRFMQDYEKERKARALIEEVCDELAKELREDKAEVETLKRESMKLQEELNEERRMLQMAEVWREERVHMKLIDAKLALEEKYTQMKRLVDALEAFLKTRTMSEDLKEMKEAGALVEATSTISVQDMKEFTYEPPSSDDIFSVLEEVNCGELNEENIKEHVPYSPTSHASKVHAENPKINLQADAFDGENGDQDEDDEDSGWETVSHLEDEGSSYSAGGSDLSANKNNTNGNVSGSGTEWEHNPRDEIPSSEIREPSSILRKQSKKVSTIAKLLKTTNNGDNYKIISVGANGRLSNGRISNGGITSPDRGSGKGEIVCSPDFAGQWGSPDSGNPHIARGMKGCIEWPLGMQKGSLKAKLLEARMESQKVQLRQVLKQKY